MTHPKSDAQIRQEARQWLMVLNDADATEDEKRDFALWLKQSDREKQAWERAKGLWSRLDDLAPALAPATTMAKPATAANDTGSFRPTRRRMITGAAAAVVGMASGGSYLLTHPEIFADHKTGTDAGKTVTLADGSLVELARSSAISVSWSPQAGALPSMKEALFTARHDPLRPFIVDAGPAMTRTAGGIFDVNRLNDTTVVTTIAHELTVTPPQGGILLTAGQQMRCAAGGAQGPLAVETASVLGWRNNRIIADGMMLSDLTTELSRYRRGRILITDARLRALPVTAALDATDPDAAIETLAASLRLRVRHFTPWLVTLSAAS